MSSVVPPTAYKSGTTLTVGSHSVVIKRYLSQGGFAHVYICSISPPWKDQNVVCLKRVAVPDKPTLNILRQEVDAMRRLQGKSCIVSYIDSHASRISNGPGYEVFVLMEYCSRNGLIDFMNTRLVNKLSETEILQIMGEITEGVAHMHALQPVLIHKDIKIENVLISGDGHYKLCDFGSASLPLRPPRNVEEFEILQDDILKHTTPQYRAPEMIDLYRRQPIDEKSDVWALGVFLYKICYYTTPFESNSINGNGNGGGGEYAILNAIYRCPSTPHYSPRLKNMIAKLLVVNPQQRPTVFQLLEEICKMRGVAYPGIYPQKAPALTEGQQPPPPRQAMQFNNPPPPQHSVRSSATTPTNADEKRPALPMRRDRTTGTMINKAVQSFNENSLHKSTSERYISKINNGNNNARDAADPFSNIDKSKISSFHSNKSASDINTIKSLGETSQVSILKPPYTHGKGKTPSTSFNAMTDPPKPRSRQSSSRPISMSAAEFQKLNDERSGAMSPIETIISGMTQEEIVELSPNNHTNIESSVDFLKNLSRPDFGGQQKTGDSFKSRRVRSTHTGHNKRSSISSLKDLLTGGRSRDSSRQSSYASRNASGYLNHLQNGSSDSLNEFSSIRRISTGSSRSVQSTSSSNIEGHNPEQGQDHKLSSSSSSSSSSFATLTASSKPSIPSNHPPKRSNSIQRRVQMLLSRKESPPPSKTASGYGKYTETITTQTNNLNNKSTAMPPPQVNKINKIPMPIVSKYRSPSPSPSSPRSNNHLTPLSSSSTKHENIFKTPSHHKYEYDSNDRDDDDSFVSSSPSSNFTNSTMSTPLQDRGNGHKHHQSSTLSNLTSAQLAAQASKKKPKAPPPPKPKKPIYLKSPASSKKRQSVGGRWSLVPEHSGKASNVSDGGSEFDDVDLLERQFKEKFPSAM